MSTSKPIHIGVLIVPEVQLLDLSPVDLFGMLGKEYLTACRLPPSLIAMGLTNLSITYIASSGPGSIAATTASAGVKVDAGLTSPTVAPGKLDILLIPGPDPFSKPDEAVLEFVRNQVAAGTTLMTVCSGVIVPGYAGILNGKKVTGPRAMIEPQLKKWFPAAKWSDRRWEVDDGGKIWTAGGITNGQDMVAAYIKQRWPGPLSDAVCAMADVGDRGRDYPSGKTANTAWWVWTVFRAWFGGISRQKAE